MEQKTLEALQFSSVLDRLRTATETTMGQLLVDQLRPQADAAEYRLAQTEEVVTWNRLRDLPSMKAVTDVRPWVQYASLDGTLRAEQLAVIADALGSVQRIRAALGAYVAKQEAPWLNHCHASLADWRSLEHQLRTCIDEQGAVLDQASEALARIRRNIRSSEQSIRNQLESLLRNSTVRSMLQETLITVRNDRFVVPVKAEYKATFAGIVHDQSASGATCFIEPQTVVTANNQLRSLRLEEQAEIERVLYRCSQMIAAQAEALGDDVATVGQLDFACAKARLAGEMRATRPEWDAHGRVALYQARHPLIDPERVVPIDVVLERDQQTMLITGPNTGGKTVTLKTVGLLHIMALSGLYIPAREGSVCAQIDEVFVDIGDDQDIAHNLSTFSSHMKTIIAILERMTENSLVLLDEVGVGTDPAEGAALAMAIIDHIRMRGSKLIATTHYRELKAYAFHTPHTVNAAMGFDVETLQPTYVLRIGVPGSSHGLTIARRLGLSESILSTARKQLSQEDMEVEQMLTDLEQRRQAATMLQEQALRIRAEAQEEQQRWQKRNTEWHEQQAQRMQEARSQARRIIATAKQEATTLLSDLHKQREMARSTQHEQQMQQRVRQFERQTGALLAEPLPKRTEPSVRTNVYVVGDEVHVISLQRPGTIVALQGDQVTVQIGVIKMTVSRQDIEPVPEQRSTVKKNIAIRKENALDQMASVVARTSLDVRGMAADDALVDIDRWIDESLRHRLATVMIIHGKGKGILRQHIHRFLQKHRRVRTYRIGDYQEGGDGVTVVMLE